MDVLQAAPPSICTSKVALAAGSTTTLSNTGTILFSIRGKAYSKAAMTNAATPTTDGNTGNAFVPIPIPLTSPNLPGVPNAAQGYGCVYLVGLNHSGALVVCQGSITALDVNGNFITAPEFPTMPNDFCPIGYILVELGASAVATWTFGTNNLSGVTGVTYVFVDLMGLPDRPQVS